MPHSLASCAESVDAVKRICLAQQGPEFPRMGEELNSWHTHQTNGIRELPRSALAAMRSQGQRSIDPAAMHFP